MNDIKYETYESELMQAKEMKTKIEKMLTVTDSAKLREELDYVNYGLVELSKGFEHFKQERSDIDRRGAKMYRNDLIISLIMLVAYKIGF
jgi:hypothetical protein